MFGDAGGAEQVRFRLLEQARSDPRIVGAAVTGSAARGAADRWSDIDLYFGVQEEPAAVLADWSPWVYAELGALHHFDLYVGATTYRAFLLADLLEIDLAFAPVEEFGRRGPGAFEVVFGTPVDPVGTEEPAAEHIVGLAWHHVLHARIAVERGQSWQAEHWISAVRDEIITLAAKEHGVATAYAKGAHLLPAEVTDPLPDGLVRALDETELRRALRAVTAALVPYVAPELVAPLIELAGP